MTKTEFINTVANKKAALGDANVTKRATTEWVEAVLAAITDTLVDGESIKLTGFGNFEVVERAAHEGINPQTQEKLMIPAAKSVKFKPSKNLKEAMNA